MKFAQSAVIFSGWLRETLWPKLLRRALLLLARTMVLPLSPRTLRVMREKLWKGSERVSSLVHASYVRPRERLVRACINALLHTERWIQSMVPGRGADKR